MTDATQRETRPAAGTLRLLYLAFVVSGAAGLIYELVWTRYLALLVGHSAYAQVLVIAVYLSGLAAGALLIGDRSRSLRRPLVWYAAVEASLALAGLLYHPVFTGVTGLAYDSIFPALAGTRTLGAVKWGFAVLLILPQATLLGTTFPLMTAGLLRRFPPRAGRSVALLYFANTIGGAAGILLAGFGLIAWFAMPGTLATAACFNLVAAGCVVAVARKGGSSSEWTPDAARDAAASLEHVDAAAAATAAASVPTWLERPVLWRLLLGVSFGTAVASFIYEIGWIRMLSLVMGSATHSFELMLSAFILGLAIGALWIRDAADTSTRPLSLLGRIQWLMGLAAVATLPVYLRSFDVMAWLVNTVERTPDGYAVFSLVRYGLALGVMLPSTILAGMTLPLITATLLRSGSGERAIGWVYGLNTLGSVVGVAAAGMLLIPWLGLKNMLVMGATLDMAIGVVLLAVARDRAASPFRAWRPALATALLTFLVASGAGALRLDRALLSSGVFRYGEVPDQGAESILFYKDGRTATVTAYHSWRSDRTVLSTNGKPDASLSDRWLTASPGADGDQPAPIDVADESTQILSGLLPQAFVPDARTAAVIGHGSGITGHYLLSDPDLERVTTIEIEPAMIRGSEAFYPANRRVFDDPRSHFVIDDAKSFFAHRQERFDIISSEPSNPWVSGVAGLFSTEFYHRVKDYIAPGGVFLQWVQLYEMTDDLILTVLASLHENFADYRVFMVAASDLLVVASPDRPLRQPDWSVFRRPTVQHDLRRVPEFTPDYLAAMEMFDRRTLAPLLASGVAVNSDYDPVLDLHAERARFMDTGAQGIYGLARNRLDIVRALEERRRGFTTYTLPPVTDLASVYQRGRANWIHDALRGNGVPTAVPAPAAALAATHAAWSRQAALVRQLADNGRPGDWKAWVDEVATLDHAMHAGTAGVVDTTFADDVYDVMGRYSAPAEVRDAVDFLLGTAAWDFGRALPPAERIVDRLEHGDAWVNPAVLLDGMVVGYLRAGDVAAARSAYDRLAPYTTRPPHDFRMRLLRAHIAAAAHAAGAGG